MKITLKKIGLLKCIILALISFASCNRYSNNIENVLELAGENRKEIEKVLSFYNPNSKDSLKYKAAVFLIENMPGHSFKNPDLNFNEVFDSIQKHPLSDRFRKDKFQKMLDSLTKEYKYIDTDLIADISYVKSDFLIQNIELAFEAWHKIPKEKRASFEDFCNYILPYRNSNEPIEVGTRKHLLSKYSWAHDLLQNGEALKFIVDSITSNFGYKNLVDIKNYYPAPLNLSQIEKSRLGLCDDGVNYFVNVFRSLGIISSKDLISRWGNHHSSGHSWIYTKYGDEEYSTQISGHSDVKVQYIGESIPKINRITYAIQNNLTFLPFAIDVTETYVPTININVDNTLNAPLSKPVICVFDVNQQWAPVAYGKINEDNSFGYSDLGVNVLYMAATISDNKITPANHPFFVSIDKKIHYFKPAQNRMDSVLLTRKYGLTTARHKNKYKWIKNLSGAFFEGSNVPAFKKAKVLHKISNFNSTHLQTIRLKEPSKFKYIRFNSNGKESYLCRLAFYDSNGKKLQGEVTKQNNFDYLWGDGAFDNNVLTYSGGIDFKLGFKLNEIKSIRRIAFQVRNDDNHINIGEEYELNYWDNGWNSLGKKVAKDTLLYFENSPENALFWLRNLTKGKEEHVFHFNSEGSQVWMGFDNYE